MRRALLAALVVLAGACTTENASDNVIQGTTSSTATTIETTSTTAFDGSTSPTSAPPAPALRETALLTDVVVASNGGIETLTLTFRADPVPGYDVRYVQPPIRQAGSGDEIDVAGAAFLEVRLEPASGVDLSGPDFEETYTGPDRVTGETTSITEVVRTGDYEANLTWVVGLAGEVPYRVGASSAQIVIELPAS